MSAQINFELLSKIFPAKYIGIDHACLILDERHIPIKNGVIRFREGDGYNATFALQWNKYNRNQLDDENGTSLTRERFLRETEWKLEDLEGKLILEAGCGAGRFTRLLARAKAEVISFDYSSAVDVCAENNAECPGITFMQCDIFDMPFKDGAFDYIFCHGVLQHTPDPEQAFYHLNQKLRPGGHISVDIYFKDGRIRPWKSKYIWRPLTTRIRPDRLLAFLEWFIPKWLPFDTFIKRIPVAGNYLGAIIPCWNYFYTALSPSENIQWAIMDTFDALAPAFDNPVTLEGVRGWFSRCGYTNFQVREGGNGVVGNGVKP